MYLKKLKNKNKTDMFVISFKYYCSYLLMLCCITFINNGIAQNVSSKDIVTVNVKTEKLYNKNKIIDVGVNLLIKDGWHINAYKPLNEYLTPTVISLKDTSAIKIIDIKYPPPLLKKLNFSQTRLALYENAANIKLELILKKGFNKSILKLNGELQYQPCNDQTCLFPVSKPFDFVLHFKK